MHTFGDGESNFYNQGSSDLCLAYIYIHVCMYYSFILRDSLCKLFEKCTNCFVKKITSKNCFKVLDYLLSCYFIDTRH